MTQANGAVPQRTDMSEFIVHLTKHDKPNPVKGVLGEKEELQTARQKLASILASCMIQARTYHSLFESDLKKQSEEVKTKFKVVCLSETPLHEIRHLTVPLRKGSIELQPYGVVFDRQRIVDLGGNEAFYVTGRNADLAWDFYRQWQQIGMSTSPGLLPCFNLLNSRYDYTWEREWRMIGDLGFMSLKSIRGIILPDKGEEQLAMLLRDCHMPVIQPYMDRNQVVAEMGQVPDFNEDQLVVQIQHLCNG